MDPIYEAYNQSINEAKLTGTMSLRDFFQKYTGNSKWYNDDQTANVMTINGTHAQDAHSKMELIRIMKDWFKTNPTIEVKRVKSDEVEFKIDKNVINIQTS